MHKKIRRILYIVSLCLSISALLWTVYIGIRIYPAFSFTDSIDESMLLRKSAFPIIASAVCLIAMSGEGGKLRTGTLTAIAIASALPTLTIVLLYAQHGTPSYYQSAAVMFYACPYALARLAADLIGRRAKTCAPAIVICALMLPFAIGAAYCSIQYTVIALLIIMYAALPVSLLLMFASVFASARTKIVLSITAAILPLYCLIIPYAAEQASSMSGIVFCAAYVCCIISIIHEIKDKQWELNKKEYQIMANKEIAGLGFHHVALQAKDFEKSLEFYKALGLEPLVTWGEGDGKIQMLDFGDGGILELFAGGNDSPDSGKWLHFAMRADDVDAAYAKALSAGAKSKIAPKEVSLDSKPYKMTIRIAFVYGPDNEQLEFFKVISKEG